jgi:hypothetical protein
MEGIPKNTPTKIDPKEKYTHYEKLGILLGQLDKERMHEKTMKRMQADFDEENKRLVENGHCPRGRPIFNEFGYITGYEGMDIPQKEYDKSEIGKLRRKWYLENLNKENKE